MFHMGRKTARATIPTTAAISTTITGSITVVRFFASQVNDAPRCSVAADWPTPCAISAMVTPCSALRHAASAAAKAAAEKAAAEKAAGKESEHSEKGDKAGARKAMEQALQIN